MQFLKLLPYLPIRSCPQGEGAFDLREALNF